MLILMAGFALFSQGCSTNYYSYQGSKELVGGGGASKKVNGIDLWIDGAPPRKFEIIGIITDSRPGRGPAMAARDGKIAAVAKENGGQGILMGLDERDFVGMLTTGSATTSLTPAFTGGLSGFSSGSGFGLAAVRRNAKFYVIRYLE